MNNIISQITNIAENFEALKSSSIKIKEISELCSNAIRSGNKIILCGNGGSAADAQHLAAELIGKYEKERKSYFALALTTNSSILTAVGNDFDFDKIFERQIEGVGTKGDVLVGLTTSGNSKNVIRAIEKAKELGIKTIALTGLDGGNIKEVADIVLNVPSNRTSRIQEMHIAVGHIICGEIENNLK